MTPDQMIDALVVQLNRLATQDGVHLGIVGSMLVSDMYQGLQQLKASLARKEEPEDGNSKAPAEG